jgi:nanoRNase/pAp phosphatase (c-di-AMP/oligoRNAs hydrolase)
MAIFLHDNPDPDTIASALALRKICALNHVAGTLYHGGVVSHPQNRALVRLLRIPLEKLDSSEEAAAAVRNHSMTALVESSRPGQNNILPQNTDVQIIIDHHQTPPGMEERAAFVDIRPGAGAASTILTDYLQRLWIRPDPNLASALLFGIKVDTDDFTRNVGPSDLTAAVYLSEHADLGLIRQFEEPPMPRGTAEMIARAVRENETLGARSLSYVGTIRDRDALAMAAEFLLRMEDVDTAVVFGVLGDRMCLSGRTDDPSVNLGALFARAFGAGVAGGHAATAGAQIPLSKLTGGGRPSAIRAASAVRRLLTKAARGLQGTKP